MKKTKAATKATAIVAQQKRDKKLLGKRVAAVIEAANEARYSGNPEVYHDEKKGWLFRANGVEFGIDPRSLNRTLGCGDCGYGKGLIDELPSALWKRILDVHGLPHDPFNRELAMPPVRRIVQRAFWEALEPEKCTEQTRERDQICFRRYMEEHARRSQEMREAEIKGVATGAARNAKRAPMFQKKHYTYQPTASFKKLKDAGGQQKTIFEWFIKNKSAAATIDQITADLVAAGFTCNQDPRRVVAFYMAAWKKQGHIEQLG